MLQAFTETSINMLQNNWFELALVGVAMVYARGTIIPKFLFAYCLVFGAYQAFMLSELTEAIKLYNAGVLPFETVNLAYNSFYVMGGLIFMCMALMLAAIKPLQSKTGFLYCIALCIQSLLSISMFLNGLQVANDSGELVINIPDIEFVAVLHSFVNEKMVIITVVIAWTSVILSRTAKR